MHVSIKFSYVTNMYVTCNYFVIHTCMYHEGQLTGLTQKSKVEKSEEFFLYLPNNSVDI